MSNKDEMIEATEDNIKYFCQLFKLTYIGISRINGFFICSTNKDFNSEYFQSKENLINFEICTTLTDHNPILSLNPNYNNNNHINFMICEFHHTFLLNKQRELKLKKILKI